jgi:excisionase family DNA binding protein
MQDKAESPTAVTCSVEKFAELSGLSDSTVRRYVKAGKLPHNQPGGRRCRILIPLSALSHSGSGSASVDLADPTISEAASNQPEQPENLERLPGPKPRWARQGQAALK